MSGSPPYDSRSNPPAMGLGHGGYAPAPQIPPPGMQTSQPDPRIENFRPQQQPQDPGYYSPAPPHQPQSLAQQSQVYGPPSYAPIPRHMPGTELSYSPNQYYQPRQQQPLPGQSQLPDMMSTPIAPMFAPQESRTDQYPPVPVPDKSAPTITDTNREQSPKAQRKAKGHVAAACMPCKRAHLK